MSKYIRLFEEYQGEFGLHSAISKYGESLEELTNYLKKFNVPLEKYGTEGYKTVSHLLNEIKEGETVLTEKNDKLHRYVEFIGARVIYKDKNGDNWRLYETKQVFKDGRTRVRSNMPYSMAEKFKSGEDTRDGIIRGMKEELGIDITKDQFVFFNKVEIENNEDYPGIISHHIGHEFLVILNDDQFNPDGYIERQVDKNVYFGWKKMSKGLLKESINWMSLLK